MSFTGDQPPWRTGLLLEREREMAALESLLADLSGPSQGPAATGTGGLLVFAGSAGLGKTTLLNEVRRRTMARGCTVLSARGGEQEQGVAFQVVRHLLQPLLATGTEEEHREALGTWYDIVAPAVGLVAAPSGSPDPQGVRDGLDWIVTRFAVQRAPLVMMLDDAHWADAESLAWLTGFAPRVTELPMLLVVAYRPDELPRDAMTFGRLALRHGSRPLDLAPLTPGAVSRIVRDTLGEDADEAFCRETWAVTGGNPFEAVELAARVADRGLKPQVVHLPELRELASAVKGGGLVERLERLGTSAVRFAWSVAVLGAGASRSRAASLGGLGEAESADAVTRLREARISSRSRPATGTKRPTAASSSSIRWSPPPSTGRFPRPSGSPCTARPPRSSPRRVSAPPRPPATCWRRIPRATRGWCSNCARPPASTSGRALPTRPGAAWPGRCANRRPWRTAPRCCSNWAAPPC